MAQPGVPGEDDDSSVDLPCGRTVPVADFHLGMREYQCACGDSHAVVLDPHPLSRFVPEDTVEVLKTAIGTSPDDEFEEFGIAHLLGAVMEEHPQEMVVHDASRNGSVGYALLWVASFDARELHRRVVELVVNLMEHALGHAEDDAALQAFETQLADFDVDAFVDEYREVRDFEDEWDEPT
ncbi:Uncharacterized protein HSRCO_2494 [Halanaeroarchaeum sp. HSR-CO]|uniref:DUF5815 family protein n=1 Tax=Halanaeroarchaeum sp. HSR-CO TaxID=2866382 RepID=UPI00217E83C8|nr:DUF5815 family protein [Halanaeroarchaeum sp. HSR-CO]UWG48758.1 Uncharacterized protein HSRCO_2494 [Halanaeroarchaeum sp. HSR-CO]